ncbi:hypothetical protein MRB53_013163 [Persea americana]|uniref:Uncharacterized protein n=1 Tax=Persea americana TaxID=3435 RepID=A0ACC2K7A7_PERAE|nr:hypothetical protein MRB53_013163 [Persea americana]
MKPLTKPNLVLSPPQPHLVSLAPWRPVSTLSERDCSCHCILSCTKPSSVFAALSAFFTKSAVTGGGEERETSLPQCLLRISKRNQALSNILSAFFSSDGASISLHIRWSIEEVWISVLVALIDEL